MKIAIINGPNLNLLGSRETHIYGALSLDQINEGLTKSFQGKVEFSFFQSNQEGELVDIIQKVAADGLVVNLAAFTHTSVALRDVLLARQIPCVEVHLSNIFAREEFRRHSFISDIAVGVVSGFGAYSYHLGVMGLLGY
jgi:3-dehydroquinate dehydratase-2